MAGEVRDEEGWRTAFKLRCNSCGKHWIYAGGIYRGDIGEKETQG